MIVIKAWAQHPDFNISCKGSDKITIYQAWMLIQAANDGTAEGHVRVANRPERFKYTRYPNGRIIIEQCE